MESSPHNPILVVGVGNEDRGDDGAGIAAARLLREMVIPNMRVVEHGGEGTDLIDLWRNAAEQTVILIDAMRSGGAPGTVVCLEAHDTPLPAHLSGTSSHLFGVAQAVELARVLGYLPRQLLVYAIDGKCFDTGAPLSPEVQSALAIVADAIATLVVPRGA